MTDFDRITALEHAHDAIEALVTEVPATAHWLTSHNQAVYSRALNAIHNAGFDIFDFHLPADSKDEYGDIPMLIFRVRATLALKFLKRQIARIELATRAETAMDTQEEVSLRPVRNAVFVVHGRDNDAVDMMFALLREVGITPAAFEDARRMTGRPMPYIGEVLEAAFANAQAVLVLFTPDERVELAERLRPRDQLIQVEHQPRPNVLIEAGVALTTHPDRTVIVEMGKVRNISDLAGRHMVRMAEDTPALRSEVLDRLEEAGCQPVREGARWMEVGKKERPSWS